MRSSVSVAERVRALKASGAANAAAKAAAPVAQRRRKISAPAAFGASTTKPSAASAAAPTAERRKTAPAVSAERAERVRARLERARQEEGLCADSDYIRTHGIRSGDGRTLRDLINEKKARGGDPFGSQKKIEERDERFSREWVASTANCDWLK